MVFIFFTTVFLCKESKGDSGWIDHSDEGSVPCRPGHIQGLRSFLFFCFFFWRCRHLFYKWLVSGTIIGGTPALCDGGCFQLAGDLQEQITHIFIPFPLTTLSSHVRCIQYCVLFFYFAIHSIYYNMERTFNTITVCPTYGKFHIIVMLRFDD